jgi:L-lysine exporter family protein LysE/ArgO
MGVGSGLISRGVLLGIGAAAPIGPVNVEIARRTFRGGFWAGFALGCGAVTVDITYAVLSSLSLQTLLDRKAVMRPIEIAGIGFLLYLAFLSFRAAVRTWRGGETIEQGNARPRHGVAYVTGLLITLLNPMTLGFWFLAVPAALGAVTKQPGKDLPWICAGVFIGTIAWVIGFAGAMAWAGRFRRAGWLAAADAAGGAVLFCFAIVQVWRVVRRLL